MFLFYLVALCLAQDGFDLSGRQIDGQMSGIEVKSYSFSPPYSRNNWLISGLAMITPDKVILTRDLPSVQGSIWNKQPVKMRDWQVLINFRIISNQKLADGLAFWYTSSSGSGSAYGAPQQFTGIGVAVDTYSNQYYGYEKMNVLFNRGNNKFNADDDGLSLLLPSEGDKTPISCSLAKDYVALKMAGKKTIKLLIRYFNNTLSVYFAGYYADTWSLCGKYDGILLPTGYFFGVSAETGGLHSAHELVNVKVFELDMKHSEDSVSLPTIVGISNNPLEKFEAWDSTSPDSLKNKSDSIWWTAFTLSAYTAFVAVVGWTGLFLYRELTATKKASRKFY